MPSINQVILIGNVSKINFGTTNNGSDIVTLTVCTDRKFTNSKGEENKEVEFHKVTCWSRIAENAKKYVIKNTLVYVEGRLCNKRWTTPEGEERFGYEIVAEKLLVLRKPSFTESQEEDNFNDLINVEGE
jgi:single-strand DNA-binding protein